MKKTAGVGNVGAEEVEQLRHEHLTRETCRAQADALFGVSPDARKKAKEELEALFVQAPAARTSTTKTAAATEAYFDAVGEASKTEAQRRYPELLEVASRRTGK